MAYDRLEPIGDRRLDLLIAELAYVTYNSLRLVGTKMEEKSFLDFVPKWFVDEEQEAEDQAEALKNRATAVFGRIAGSWDGS